MEERARESFGPIGTRENCSPGARTCRDAKKKIEKSLKSCSPQLGLILGEGGRPKPVSRVNRGEEYDTNRSEDTNSGRDDGPLRL